MLYYGQKKEDKCKLEYKMETQKDIEKVEIRNLKDFWERGKEKWKRGIVMSMRESGDVEIVIERIIN